MRAVIRLFQVWSILAKYRLDQLLPHTWFSYVLSVLIFITPSAWRNRALKNQSIESRLRRALEDLGPIYVKFGQAVSTRPDLLPAEMVKELSKLQDKVKPFSTDIAIKTIEDALGQSIDKAFLTFDDSLLGSASIAQVYSATLSNQASVVVKVIRPGIEKVIKSDIAIMYLLTGFVNLLYKEAKRLRLSEVIQEFENTIYSELDLIQEAANCTALKNNFSNSEIIYVPDVYWDYCRKNVMVMEKINGVSVTDMDALKANKVNLKLLAERGVEIFFTQVFYHQYFHADMHPGNVFVDISNPENPRYIAVDFGIMGSLNDEDQYYLAENFLAFFNRDYRRVAELHINSGWVPSSTKVTEFEASIRRASEPIFGKSLKEISFAQFLLTLFQTARKHNMEIQPQLVLLQKTFFNVEGLGRVLYPDLNLWDTGKPILEKWMKDQFSPKTLFNKFKKQSREYSDVLIDFPLMLKQQLKDNKQREKSQTKQYVLSISFGVLLFIGLQPNLWGGEISRVLIAIILLGLVRKLLK